MRVPESMRDVVRLAGCAGSARFLRDSPAFAALLRDRTRRNLQAQSLRSRELTVYPKVAGGHPVVLRTGTTDIVTYREALVKRYHMPGRLKRDVGTIIDMGANIGLVSLDLARTFPQARIVAVELDRGNFDLLQRNLAGLSDRVLTLHAAVWSHSGGVPYSLACEENAFAVSEQPDQAHPLGWAPSTTPADLMPLLDGDQADYVKMDIEGAEQELLLSADVGWLEQVEAISVEVHRGVSAGAIAEILEKAGFSVRALTRHRNALEAYRY
jgi:FkbM family methyltransferase